MKPAFNVANCWFAAAALWDPCDSRACLISAQAATMELRTINPKENKVMEEIEPPNHRTSPYAVKIMVRFLKIVYTGIERN